MPAVCLIHGGGGTHVVYGYTWVSQNTSFGLNVVLGPQLVGNNEGGHRVPRISEGFGHSFCMKKKHPKNTHTQNINTFIYVCKHSVQ